MGFYQPTSGQLLVDDNVDMAQGLARLLGALRVDRRERNGQHGRNQKSLL
ncbi:MAG: hypothetical protein ACTS5Y_03720 [Pollutimonas bauzanensis]